MFFFTLISLPQTLKLNSQYWFTHCTGSLLRQISDCKSFKLSGYSSDLQSSLFKSVFSRNPDDSITISFWGIRWLYFSIVSSSARPLNRTCTCASKCSLPFVRVGLAFRREFAHSLLTVHFSFLTSHMNPLSLFPCYVVAFRYFFLSRC